LDVRRENAVSAAVQRTRVTRIIVAHRPETIRSADRALVLEQGKIMKSLQVLADDHHLPLSLTGLRGK